MTTPSPTDTDEENTHSGRSECVSPPADQAAKCDAGVAFDETLPEAIRRLTAANPRFREAAPSSKAFGIIGARPSKPPR
jgi:hypothetical protein